jgi:putative heme-binding domain-containing protein
MYVTVTTTYPHVFPGDVPNDKVIVLEDLNHDGVADKSTVFAEGLNIPTGIELGDGGVYIGQNTEILFLRDTNGDGKADSRRVLLGGFGNGDSHQTINSFIWSPGGELFFGHGDGCESRVETPWGSADLFNAGFYRFRPGRIQLVPFLEGHMAAGNPWGVAFDSWGQAISVDGAGGVNWLTPGLISTTHVRRLKRIGNPGGYCGVGFLDGRHIPESMQGHFVTGDFKSNRVKRFTLKENGSGFVVDWKEPLLHSQHRNFRPVDVKIGPDGAIYIVDWYNPITCHQDDAYRHPERDKAHGRIWRVSSKTAQPVRPLDLNEASIEQLVEQLGTPEYWTRYQAKRALTTRNTKAAAKALDQWVRWLDPKDAQYEHHLFAALGAFATIEVVEPRLLKRLLNAADSRARAYACRIVARWHDRLDDPLALLAARIVDSNARVRLEAVVACSAIPNARAIEVAARVVDMPMDEWLEYAFKQTVHALRPHWLPAFRDGKVTFPRPNQLAAVLNESGGREVIGSLKELVESGKLNGPAKSSAISAIISVGSPEDIDRFALDRKRFTDKSGKYDAKSHAATLARLVELAEFRDVKLTGNPAARISDLLTADHTELKANALTLAGLWKLEKTHDLVVAAAKDHSLPVSVRLAAFVAMGKLNLSTGKEMLSGFASSPGSTAIRSAAVRALFEVEVDAAAKLAAELISTSDLKSLDAGLILAAGLRRSGGANALASALKSTNLSPEQAKLLLRSLYSTGWTEKSLVDELLKASGAVAQTPEFSRNFVRSLVTEAKSKGDTSRGAKYFRGMACVSCHRVTGVGGEVGPDLTAIGTTLSGERIVEELIWPNRQIKEGFAQLIVVTNDGKVFTGYERKTRDTNNRGDIILEDPVSKKRTTIRKADIDETHPGRSAMPAGLTALLSRDQLLDLIRYLTKLGRIE